MRFFTFIKFLSVIDLLRYLFLKPFYQFVLLNKKFSELSILHNQLSIIEIQLKKKVINNDNEIVIHNGNNFHLRKNTSDIAVYHQIYYLKEYKTVVDFILNQFKLQIDHIIDVGANIGCATCYFLEHFPNANVISIEPDHGNFNMLVKNTNWSNKVQTINAAVWDKSINLRKAVNFRDGREWSSSYEIDDNQIAENAIKVVTLKEIVANAGLTGFVLLKIDVEGAEKHLFTADSDLNYLQNIHFLALEIHDEVCDRQLIESLIRENGFVIFDYNETTLAVRKTLFI